MGLRAHTAALHRLLAEGGQSLAALSFQRPVCRSVGKGPICTLIPFRWDSAVCRNARLPPRPSSTLKPATLPAGHQPGALWVGTEVPGLRTDRRGGIAHGACPLLGTPSQDLPGSPRISLSTRPPGLPKPFTPPARHTELPPQSELQTLASPSLKLHFISLCECFFFKVHFTFSSSLVPPGKRTGPFHSTLQDRSRPLLLDGHVHTGGGDGGPGTLARSLGSVPLTQGRTPRDQPQANHGTLGRTCSLSRVFRKAHWAQKGAGGGSWGPDMQGSFPPGGRSADAAEACSHWPSLSWWGLCPQTAQAPPCCSCPLPPSTPGRTPC